MKKIITLLITLAVLLSSTVTVFAADGKVTYSGNAGNFVFEPGSEHSLTDLFPNFKGVMPGDTLTQKITVKNDADNKVKVKIYIRSLGAHEDSVEFLSQLGLKVSKSEENKMAYMFDAAANETAQLTDWVYLGTSCCGGKIDLDVTLNVPITLENRFQDAVGYLDWQFKVEELPVSPDDPKPPQTGDTFNPTPWVLMMVSSLVMIILLVVVRRRKENTDGCTK